MPGSEQVTVTEEMVDAARRVLDGQQLKWLAVSPAGRKAITRAALVAALDASSQSPVPDEQAIRNEERVKVLDWLRSDEAVSAVADRLRDVQARGISTTAPGQAITATRALGDALATLDQEGPCKRCGGDGQPKDASGEFVTGPPRSCDCLDQASVGKCKTCGGEMGCEVCQPLQEETGA